MDEFTTEKEQIEQLRNWWSENGRFVITGLVLGIGTLGGWRYWQNYTLERAEAASQVFETLVEAVSRTDRSAAVSAATQLRADYSATPYADKGEFVLARLYVDIGDTDSAAELLEGLVSEADTEQGRHLARLRLARVLLEQGKTDEALKAVEDDDVGSFASQYHEVRGDIHVARGDMSAASEAYQLALDTAQPGLADAAMLQMKLNDASGAGPVASNDS